MPPPAVSVTRALVLFEHIAGSLIVAVRVSSSGSVMVTVRTIPQVRLENLMVLTPGLRPSTSKVGAVISVA